MKALTLFTGIGAPDLALERNGAEVSAMCEIDENCVTLLGKRFPGVRVHGDVTELEGEDVGSVDLVCAGWPCQDLSIGGDRAGLVGERSGLFFHLVRISRELTPRWLLLENVTGLLSSHGGRDMGVVLGALAELGYGFAYRVLNTECFGVPQYRRRVFIVGCLGDPRSAGEVLFEPEGSAGPPRQGRSNGPLHARRRAEDIAGGSEPFVMRWRGGKPGGGKGALISKRALTLATGNDQIVFHDGVARYFTPLERERLMGFPDGWTEGFPDTVRYRMLGNSIPVPVLDWIIRRMMKVEAQV